MRSSILLACLLMAAVTHTATSALAQTPAPRFPPLSPDAMSPEQRAMYDAVMAGPRHSTAGPFNAWLRSPVLGDRLQRVGEYLRFQTAMPHNLNEFAILITAVEWNASFEWYAHYPLALKAGLEPGVARDLQEGRRPAGMTADEALVYDFATQLHRQHRVSDPMFSAAVKRFGEQGVTDLIALLGYYTLVSMTLNVAEVEPPQGGPTLDAPMPGAPAR
jgi:4-carboxymuconolactone decarboxylase